MSRSTPLNNLPNKSAESGNAYDEKENELVKEILQEIDTEKNPKSSQQQAMLQQQEMARQQALMAQQAQQAQQAQSQATNRVARYKGELSFGFVRSEKAPRR